ncbi:MAG: cobalamin 5'-phosphate synthase [Candidatus Brocadia sinica]|uniref:Adenosylcobinamide-GDP ribazoletransferase n=2 Tax=Candidatus Brocadiaceae TaxID=1127830 RepID=A0ABQ0JTA3_9BACT|nr:MAG: cobalamin 5'-phosphate synthase [Candidatus Brocadia sinica]GAN31956.1 cobalamin-5-phosphate synthase [Candidatus Brocadia sinica JPN1]
MREPNKEKKKMDNFLWALKFLTIIPVDREDRIKPQKVSYVIYWFPIVGLCIGVFLSVTYLPLFLFFPPLLADALIILVCISITGALHLDGLADTCDGIWGGWNKEKRLEIMRDSRIGSFGVIGLICLLGLKYLSLFSVSEIPVTKISPFSASIKYVSCFVSPVLVNKCVVLMVMPVVGRWAQVCAAGLSLYARSGSGTGSFITGGTTRKQVIFVSLFPVFLFWFFYNLSGFVIFAIIIIFTLSWIWYIKKRIGGMTGDTLGATNEISELVFLLSLFVCSGWNR